MELLAQRGHREDKAQREAASSIALLPELAALEGIVPWLYQLLKRTSHQVELPEPVLARLRAQALEAAAFNLRVDEEAAAVLERMHRAGIAVVLLKGVARRALAVPGSYGASRSTTDVDLLVSSEEAERAFELLIEQGYTTPRAKPATLPDHHHLPTLWSERRIGVELHLSASPLVAPAETWRRATTNARATEWQGLKVLVPSATELAWQTLTHAPTEERTMGFRLRDLLDFVTLLTPDGHIEWDSIAARLELAEASDSGTTQPVPPGTLRQWLGAAASLAPEGAIPRELFDQQFDLRPLLRWRLRVLANQRRLGPRLTRRLLAESARVAVGLRSEPLPADVQLSGRLRGWLLTRASRTAFRTWRIVAGGGGGRAA